MSAEVLRTVVVVDDDPDFTAIVSPVLRRAGYGVELFASGEACLEGLSRVLPDMILLDLTLPGIDGLQTLERIRATHPLVPVVMLTATSSVETVVSAMQLGAYDYLSKPIDRTKLETTIKNAVEHNQLVLRNAQLEREAESDGYGDLKGRSAAMRQLFRQMDRLASSDITVLIHGESGTGKELVARALHQRSGRRRKPMIAINCAAIPETLQESELFGHERGAFTGATDRRIGKFEQANGGTLFLDEVAELSAPLQAKVLRAIQSKTFQRVGGSADVRSDFRLLAASHQRLAELVKAGRFREDLYFRIAVFELDVPPLRDRRDDIPLLARRFANELTSREGRRLEFSGPAMALLTSFHWPGNVRELENAVHRALVAAESGVVGPDELPPAIRQAAGRSGATQDSIDAASAGAATQSSGRPSWPLASLNLEAVERAAILEAIRQAGGNVTQAMRTLGVARTTLYRKLKHYGIEPDS